MPKERAGWAVVTGASSGLGAIFADQLAERGLSLVLAGRDAARLEQVRRRVKEKAPHAEVAVVVGDLSTVTGVDDLIGALGDRDIEILVNNAGFGTYGSLTEIDVDRERELLAVNVDALVRLTHAVLPGMSERRRGGILNVASTISFQPAPYQATYAGSKAFVLSFSQSLRAETKGTGVKVTALCPGTTRTGFVDSLAADVSGVAIYKNLGEPEPVVEAGLRALDHGRAVVVPGWRNRLLATVSRYSPPSILTWVSTQMMKPRSGA